MIIIAPSAVHSTKQSSYCWQKATNSSSVMGTRLGFKITGAIDSKSSTTNCISSVYCLNVSSYPPRGSGEELFHTQRLERIDRSSSSCRQIRGPHRGQSQCDCCSDNHDCISGSHPE